jgi:hypothetical protein
MHTKFDLTLTVATAGGTESFAIDSSHLEFIVGGYRSDGAALSKLIGIAASHPSYAVRRAIAGSEQLPVDAAIALAEDPSMTVRLQLASNEVFRQAASEEVMLRFIASDPEVAEAVANYVEGYYNADVDDLCKTLASHLDVAVRRALAGNSGTPIRWVKKLTTDPVLDVANTAKRQLENRSR